MRRTIIQLVFPFLFCLIPFLMAALVAVCVPREAMTFLIEHVGAMDLLILTLGTLLFTLQIVLAWRALRWRGAGFDESADRWLSNLAQAAEFFPMLGLIGTVAGILQTFSSITPAIQPNVIIEKYAPAITATGCGLFMALINILPPWMVLLGRDLIITLGGEAPAAEGGEQ